MGIFDFITKRGVERKTFASMTPANDIAPADRPAAVKTLTSDLVSWVLGQTDFGNMDEEDIMEQLYLFESEIGGAVDRTSTMVGEAFKGFYIKDAGAALEPLEQEMIMQANIMSETLDVRNHFEMFAEIISIKGNLYLEEDPKDLTLNILPNKYVTIIDRPDRIGNLGGKNQYDFITEENYLVLFEGVAGVEKRIPKDRFIHIKYKNTPVFETDNKGRVTFGIYSVSPLNRVIIPVWWKRQTMVLDMLVRQMNVPREHHMIDSRMFNMNLFAGTPEEKLNKATAAIGSFIEKYAADIKGKTPDQGYVTLDTTKIETINTGTPNYMQTNELINQINTQIWSALNMPKSMISGESHSSYASELIISNYVSQKILQLATKIKPVILDNMKKRLTQINAAYPVDSLDIKLELHMASTDIEMMRKMAIMGSLGIYTETELRNENGYAPLREDQRKEIVRTGVGAISGASNGQMSVNPAYYPETPQSNVQHPNDASTSAIRTDKQG